MSAKYGPGTDEVTAFILRVGTMTPENLFGLSLDPMCHEDSHYSRATARNHSLLAAIEHDLVDEWAYARTDTRFKLGSEPTDGLTEGSWRGIRNMAVDVAAALVTRHLIVDTEPRDTDFTQEDYDNMTGGWRRAVGSIHPDDHGFPGEGEN